MAATGQAPKAKDADRNNLRGDPSESRVVWSTFMW